MTGASLKRLRDRLRDKDKQLVKLLNERAAISIEIGRLKQEHRVKVYDPSQESRVYRFVDQHNEGPLPKESMKKIFCEIVSGSRALQEPVSVAYLGPEASFTHLAAQMHFGSSALFQPAATILDVFDEVEKSKARWGIIPVENSLEGTVKMTMDRLIATPLNIMNEVYLPITHVLISTRDTLDGLRRIYSHPQALAQCQTWIRKNLPHCSFHDVDSTSKAVLKVLEDTEGAAIGSRAAADMHGLTTLADGIEDCSPNMTRFLVIGTGESKPTGRDKTSIVFGTRHEPGALHESLRPFAEKEVNLLKIVSHPIKERMWEYLFFVDFQGHREEEKIGECLGELQDKCTFVKILGSYPREEWKP